MISFECTVQDGCIAEELRSELAEAIDRACSDVLGPKTTPVETSWVVIKRGFGFRGGEPSTTSMVRGRIPDGCDAKTRGRLLKSIGESWCRISGASEDELMVSARDQGWAG